MSLFLSEQLLDRLWPHAPHSLVDGMARTSEGIFARYGLTTRTEIADLMAQGSEETGGGIQIEENLNYSAARLANYAGGIVVMKRGTATVTRDELLRAVTEG